MNKTIKTALALAVGLFALGLSSCSDDRNLFDQSAAERTSTLMNETAKILQAAPNGWEMSFYPSEEMTYGGFTTLVKFAADGTVVAATEVNRDATTGSFPVKTSYYQLDASYGPTLSFGTYNEAIHLFSEPNSQYSVFSDAPINTGAAGDFNFQIISATPEKVVLRGVRSAIYAELKPVPAGEDWQQHLAAIHTSATHYDFAEFSIGQITGGMSQRHLTIEDGGVTRTMPFRFTTTGIELYEPLTINGESVRTFSNVGTDAQPELRSGSVTLTPIAPSLYKMLTTKRWFYGRTTTQGRARSGISTAKSTIERITQFSPRIIASAAVGNNGRLSFYTWIQVTIEGETDVLNARTPALVTQISDTEVSIAFDEATYKGTSEVNQILVTNWGTILFAAGFMNVGEIGNYHEDYSPRTYTISSSSKYNPKTLVLTDKSDPSNVMTLSLDLVEP